MEIQTHEHKLIIRKYQYQIDYILMIKYNLATETINYFLSKVNFHIFHHYLVSLVLERAYVKKNY